MDFNMFNIIQSMHCDDHHPLTPTNANDLYITNHPYTGTLLHVSVISHYPQGDINTQEYKINPLTPNDSYSGCTAPLNSKRCIFIYLFNK